MKCVYAYTEVEFKTYPGFISINTTDVPGELAISVRTADTSDPSIIVLPSSEVENLLHQVSSHRDTV